MEASKGRRTSLVGELIRDGRGAALRHLFGEQDDEVLALDGAEVLGDAAAGSIVQARYRDGMLDRPQLLAAPDTALAQMYGLAAKYRLDPAFPGEVEQEVRELVDGPWLDDPALTDLRALPFVTIDGPGTRDLDQAMCIREQDGALVVDYALADAAWCVRPGRPLFDEALRRGATFYLPGLAIPMLPRALSEGIVSLNPKVDRRALVFRMTLAPDGRCARTELLRARIHSRAQLTFAQVERHLADAASEPMPEGVSRSLQLLREVGELRLADASRRDVVRYRRSESEVKLSGVRGCRFVIAAGMRTSVERYNEQLSLMCNVEGARFLHADADTHEHVQPIYRVHPSPDERRYRALEDLLRAMCRRHKLDEGSWTWRRSGRRSLAKFLGKLPEQGREGRLARAIHRQAVMANVRSSFSAEPGKHHGVGADVYARFSAPMREIVGVFLHKEALEKMAGREAGHGPDDEALRELIVERSNWAKTLQKRLTKQANELVLDQLFAEDMQLPLDRRPARRGTVMGLTASKAHVQLDDPNVEVKLYTRHQAELLNDRVRVSKDGVQLHCHGGAPLCRIGDSVQVRLRERDRQGRRWVLELVEQAQAR